MRNSNVTISVITAVWNCRATVKSCLASVAEQTWPHREHVVVDGGSTDGTLEILNNFTHQLAVLRSEPDQGIYDALNKGLSLSTGEVVGFLHADDLYANPFVLERIAAAFEDPSVCAVYGDLQYVLKEDITKVVRYWKSKSFSSNLLLTGWMPPHPTLYVRRSCYEKIGGFDIRFRIAADYLSVLELFGEPDFKAVYIPEVLVLMRLGGASNKSAKAILAKSKEDWRALRMQQFGMLDAMFALARKNISKFRQFWCF